MNPNVPQGIARAILCEADHLSRIAFEEHEDHLAAKFAAVRTMAARIERLCGASPPRPLSNVEIDLTQEYVKSVIAAAHGHEPAASLERLFLLTERLRPPRRHTLVGLLGGWAR
jgi:hypothetical protein